MAVLRSRRTVRLLAAAMLLAAVCVRLGFWQLERHHLRAEHNAEVRAAMAADAQPLDVVVPPGTATQDVPREDEWRRVTVTGRYDPDGQVVLRLRPVEGNAGVHVLTPLVPASGPAVLVDRGFFAASGPGSGEQAQAQVEVPEPPSGQVSVEGRVRLSEAGRGTGLDTDRQPPSVRFVDLDALADELSIPLAPVWVEAVAEQPPADDGLVGVPEPALSSGPSLIYAVQWYIFAAIALIGSVVLARRQQDEAPRPEGVRVPTH